MITILASAVAENPGVFETIQKTFGLHGAFFAAQVINFLLVVFILKKFAFGPIQQMLEQRRNRIAEGEEKLRQIEQQLRETEKNTAAAIAKANEDAARMILEAQKSAAALSEESAKEALAQAQNIISKAEAAAKADHERLTVELKREFGRLVAATTAQVTGKVLTADDQNRINQDALAKVEG